MPIQRYFTQPQYSRMQQDFHFLLPYLRNHQGDIFFAMRENAFDLYYSGNRIASVKFEAGSNYRVAVRNAFYQGSSLQQGHLHLPNPIVKGGEVVFSLQPTALPSFFTDAYLDDLCAQIRKRGYGEETTFEQMVIKHISNPQDFFIIDRQVAVTLAAGANGRRRTRYIDLLGLRQVDGSSYRFEVFELKRGNNRELDGLVVAQLQDYLNYVRSNVHYFRSCYKQAYTQLQKLGLLGPGYPTQLNIVDDVEGAIVVIGYGSEGKPRVQRLRQQHPTLKIQEIYFEL